MKPWNECTTEEKQERIAADYRAAKDEAEELRREADDREEEAEAEYNRRMAAVANGEEGL